MSDITVPAAGAETPATPSAPETPTSPQTPPATPDTPQQPAAESQAPGEPAAETEGQPEGKEDGPKRKKTAGEYINQLKAERNDARARAAAAEAELARLRQPLKPPPPDASQDEIDRYNVKSAVRESRAEEVAQAAEIAKQEAASKRFETFNAKAEAVAERMPGLVDKFLELPVVSEEIAEFVAESEKGAEVAYYFTANPSEATRISRLPSYQQGIELARIEGRLQAAPQVRRTTQAPPPPPAMPGAPTPAAKRPEDMSPAEYSAWYRERQKKKAG